MHFDSGLLLFILLVGFELTCLLCFRLLLLHQCLGFLQTTLFAVEVVLHGLHGLLYGFNLSGHFDLRGLNARGEVLHFCTQRVPGSQGLLEVRAALPVS